MKHNKWAHFTETSKMDQNTKARTSYAFYCFQLILKVDWNREIRKFYGSTIIKNLYHIVNTSYLKFILSFEDITQKKIRRSYKVERKVYVEFL